MPTAASQSAAVASTPCAGMMFSQHGGPKPSSPVAAFHATNIRRAVGAYFGLVETPKLTRIPGAAARAHLVIRCSTRINSAGLASRGWVWKCTPDRGDTVAAHRAAHATFHRGDDRPPAVNTASAPCAAMMRAAARYDREMWVNSPAGVSFHGSGSYRARIPGSGGCLARDRHFSMLPVYWLPGPQRAIRVYWAPVVIPSPNAPPVLARIAGAGELVMSAWWVLSRRCQRVSSMIHRGPPLAAAAAGWA